MAEFTGHQEGIEAWAAGRRRVELEKQDNENERGIAQFEMILELRELVRAFAQMLVDEGYSVEPLYDPEVFEPDGFTPDAVRQRELFDKHKVLIWGEDGPPKPVTDGGPWITGRKP